jgi:hypothetical protein
MQVSIAACKLSLNGERPNIVQPKVKLEVLKRDRLATLVSDYFKLC